MTGYYKEGTIYEGVTMEKSNFENWQSSALSIGEYAEEFKKALASAPKLTAIGFPDGLEGVVEYNKIWQVEVDIYKATRHWEMASKIEYESSAKDYRRIVAVPAIPSPQAVKESSAPDKPFELMQFPGTKGSDIYKEPDEENLIAYLKNAMDNGIIPDKEMVIFNEWLKTAGVKLNLDERQAAAVIFLAGRASMLSKPQESSALPAERSDRFLAALEENHNAMKSVEIGVDYDGDIYTDVSKRMILEMYEDIIHIYKHLKPLSSDKTESNPPAEESVREAAKDKYPLSEWFAECPAEITNQQYPAKETVIDNLFKEEK